MEATDTTLLERSRRGQTEAFEALVERYQNLVCAVTFSVTGDKQLSEDLAQETFLAAWRSLDTLREPERFRGWLCTVARNLGSKARRTMGRTTALPEEEAADQSVGADEVIASRESEAMVWQALEQIAPMYREPLVLYYREGRSAKQVAKALGLSVSTVEQRLSRGRKQLRREVEDTVERALERSRPRPGFAAAVVAGLPALPSVAISASASSVSSSPSTEPTPTSPAGATTRSTVMKTMIAATLALAVGSATYGVATYEREQDDAGTQASAAQDESAAGSTVRDAVAVAGSGARAEAAALAEKRADANRGAAGASASGEGAGAVADEPALPYELNVMGPISVAMALEGGPSPLRSASATFGVPERPAPDFVRTVSGRVLDAEGHPVQGAVVIAGEKLSCVMGTSLTGQAGAVTDETGGFRLQFAHEKPLRLLAVHHEAGWSDFESIAAGAGDPQAELALRPTASLTGVVRREGEPMQADVRIIQAGEHGSGPVHLRIGSDEQGRYAVPRLPPGDYLVGVTEPSYVGAGSRPADFDEVAVRLDVDNTHDFDLAEGAFIAVVADLPEGHEIRMVTYTLLRGAHEVAGPTELVALRKSLPTGHAQSRLYGGIDLEEVMQFDDVPEGPVTVCAEVLAGRDDSRGFECLITEAGAPGEAHDEIHLHPLK